MKGVLVCSVCCYQKNPPGVDIMLKSAASWGIQVELFKGRRWQNMYETKLVYLHECLESYKSRYDYVICHDAADVVWLSDLDDFEYPRKMTFAAERNCFPDASLHDRYPMTATSYRFLNAGGFCGPMDHVLECFQKVRTIKDHKNDDQLAWSLGYLEGIGYEIDSDCEIFQTLWGHGEHEFECDHNVETDTCPFILHANGSMQGHPAYRRHT